MDQTLTSIQLDSTTRPLSKIEEALMDRSVNRSTGPSKLSKLTNRRSPDNAATAHNSSIDHSSVQTGPIKTSGAPPEAQVYQS